MIINLVVNAAQAIGDAVGAITVALALDEAPLRDASGPPVPAIRLSVDDTGSGIDAEGILARAIMSASRATRTISNASRLGPSLRVKARIWRTRSRASAPAWRMMARLACSRLPSWRRRRVILPSPGQAPGCC
jgi:hypothetical protein